MSLCCNWLLLPLLLSTNNPQQPTGPIETTSCDYESLESVNNDLFNNMDELVRTPFFKYFQVRSFQCSDTTMPIMPIGWSVSRMPLLARKRVLYESSLWDYIYKWGTCRRLFSEWAFYWLFDRVKFQKNGEQLPWASFRNCRTNKWTFRGIPYSFWLILASDSSASGVLLPRLGFLFLGRPYRYAALSSTNRHVSWSYCRGRLHWPYRKPRTIHWLCRTFSSSSLVFHLRW